MTRTKCTFHEGLIFATTNESDESVSSDWPNQRSNGCEAEASSKGFPIAWTFHDDFSLRACGV